MFKKISVVLCAGLFATAFAAGCKKDKKDGEGGGAATCDAVGAKIAAKVQEEAGDHDMSKMTPDEKKMMEDGQKGMVSALVKVCTDDKWSDDAKSCVMSAKDPKAECKDKITADQTTHMRAAMQAAMMGAMPGGTDMMAKGSDMGATGVATAVEAQGSGSGTAAAPDTAPVAPGTYPATCEGVAARASVEMTAQLPAGMPADVPAKMAAVIVSACTEDKWSQDVLDCGVTAADPKHECKDKLTADQKAHLDAKQDEFGKAMMEEMAAAGGGGDPTAAGGGSTGIPECDELLAAVKKLAACDKLPADQKTSLDQMSAGFQSINMLPDDQKKQFGEQCKGGLTGMQQMAAAYGC